jgi:hypothetical protein
MMALGKQHEIAFRGQQLGRNRRRRLPAVAPVVAKEVLDLAFVLLGFQGTTRET